MNHEMIRIDLEKHLTKVLYDAFEGDVMKQMMKEAKIEPERDFLKASLEGHGFKISSQISPRLFKLCQQVQDNLQFKDETDFYIVNDPKVNAFASYQVDEESSHTIVLNSALVERMDDDELMFALGHEIGHLISRFSELFNIIRFVFPEEERMPVFFHNNIKLWHRIAEITSDRYGYIASPKLDKCLSNFFKLSSGLDTQRVSFNPESYLAEVENALEFIKKNPHSSNSSHPENPIRIKALELFSKSKLYKSIASVSDIEADEALDQEINDLLNILIHAGSTELDTHRRYFIASGGLIIARADQKTTPNELEHITDVLSNMIIFPRALLDDIIKNDKIQETFNTSMENILRINPAERYNMLSYLASIALADKKIADVEFKILFEVGEKVFKFSRKEIAQILATRVKKEFIPQII